MKIKFTDINNVPLSDTEIHFEWNKNKRKFKSDEAGIVDFNDANPGEKVTCFQNSKDKQKFVFDPDLQIGIVFKPILADMIFITRNEEGRPVPGVKLVFEYSNNNLEIISDFSGQVTLHNIPLNDFVKAYQLIDGNKTNLQSFKNSIEKKLYQIDVITHVHSFNMKIKLVDKTGQIIRDGLVKVKIKAIEKDEITGNDGFILLENVEEGTIVECRQVVGSKQFPWHRFTFEKGIDEYILHGEKAAIYNGYSSKIESQVRMKFKLVNTKGVPIPNAVIKIEYGEYVRHKYSNPSGETMIDDVLIGDKVKVYVDIRGKSTQAEFICQEDNELHEIVFKSTSVPVYFWLVPLFLIILFIIYLASTGGNNQEEESNEKSVVKKDSIVITKYGFTIKNANTNQGVPDVSIKLFYPDTMVERKTNANGTASFKAFAHHLPQKYELHKLGYVPVSQKFKLDSVFNIKISVNDSMEIDPLLAQCGNEFQSKGKKTTIRSFKMNLPKGRFNLWYNMFNVPTKIDVYKGGLNGISPSNLIYSTQGYAKGISNPVIALDSPDSLITVVMEGNTVKTSWVYKVYCARVPVKTVQTPVNPIQ